MINEIEYSDQCVETNILDPCAKVSRLEIQQREKLARPEKVLIVFLLVKIKTKLGITIILYLLLDRPNGRTSCC